MKHLCWLLIGLVQSDGLIFEDYIIITIVPSYTRKYHKFVAICIVTSVQHK